MSSYRALSIGATVEQLGLLSVSFALIALFAAIPLGRAIDRYGARNFVVCACALISVAAGVVATTESLVLLIAAQSLVGLGLVAAAIGFQTIVANAGPMAASDARFGTFTAIVSLGQLVGPALAGALAETSLALGIAPPTDRYGTVGPLLAVAGCALAAALLATRLPHSPVGPGLSAQSKSSAVDAIGGVLRVPGMWRALVASVAVFTAIDLLSIYLPAYGTEKGWSVGFVSALLAIRAGASLATRLLVSPLVRALGRRKLLLAGCLTGALEIALVPLDTPGGFDAGGGFAASALIAMFGMAVGMGQPVTMSWVARSSPRRLRSTGLAIRLTANQVGQLVIPPAVGLVIGAFGAVWLFWSIGVLLGAVSGLIAGSRPDDIPLETHPAIPPL